MKLKQPYAYTVVVHLTNRKRRRQEFKFTVDRAMLIHTISGNYKPSNVAINFLINGRQNSPCRLGFPMSLAPAIRVEAGASLSGFVELDDMCNVGRKRPRVGIVFYGGQEVEI